jgi:hypothetical protein
MTIDYIYAYIQDTVILQPLRHLFNRFQWIRLIVQDWNTYSLRRHGILSISFCFPGYANCAHSARNSTVHPECAAAGKVRDAHFAGKSH